MFVLILHCCGRCGFVFFFFKQKTAYEMRISDWSSDVCSSDLFGVLGSALAVGSLSGALLAARRTRVRLRLLVAAAVAFGVAEIVAGVLPSYVAFMLFVLLIGLSTITLLNSANATLQVECDPALRGRVMAIYMTIVMGGTPLGAPVIGRSEEHT